MNPATVDSSSLEMAKLVDGFKDGRPELGRRTFLVPENHSEVLALLYHEQTGIVGGLPQTEDGDVLDVANVVWATGYAPDYWFVDAPIVGDDGWPVEARGVSPTVPGLYFLGIPFQYAFSSMLVAGAGRDAKFVVERIAERVAASSTSRSSAEPAAA